MVLVVVMRTRSHGVRGVEDDGDGWIIFFSGNHRSPLSVSDGVWIVHRLLRLAGNSITASNLPLFNQLLSRLGKNGGLVAILLNDVLC